MQKTVELREWVAYEPIWFVVGSILLALIIAWYAWVFFSTRRKPQRSLATLQPQPSIPPDLTNLKQKYLQLIAEVDATYQAKQISARVVHQKLSYLLRMFVFETRGHRVDTLTLADLQKTRYEQLTKAIERYYLPEFTKVQQGDVQSALTLAREVVEQWN
jgi:hypothetical protein